VRYTELIPDGVEYVPLRVFLKSDDKIFTQHNRDLLAFYADCFWLK
jgi:hypothetical protein